MGKKRYEKWEIERSANTLMEAEEIKKDPEKMRPVRREFDRRAKAIDDLLKFKKGR